MKTVTQRSNYLIALILSCSLLLVGAVTVVQSPAAPLPGGTLDPLTIPKYVTPLVIPPVMKNNGSGADNYDIAVRQFQQQILPGGIWNTINGRADAFPATTLWGYGPAIDPTPVIAPDSASQFNYPAYTLETTSGKPVNVRWINDLVDPATGNYLPHLLPVDQTLHWANPPATGCRHGVANRTDCATSNPALYTGPVPIVTHVHGAHVDPHSDGYPEAWWLPAANNIPTGYITSGTLFDDASGVNFGNLGYADYSYRNDQPATTLWYHDHTLGMTRLNVYAGPAGFYLIRNGANDLPPGVLPGPAPVAGQGVLDLNAPKSVVPTSVRDTIREIPIVIQDRSFNLDGSLFYPASRTFFDGYPGPYTGSAPISTDIAPTWNPEAFFNVMVVNGVSWPSLEVAPALYRLRLLNGCNSRFLNLSMFEVITPGGKLQGKKKVKADKLGVEIPFYQIGAEQGFLPNVVKVQSGMTTTYVGGVAQAPVAAPDPQQALLMGLAERADVIVDFRGLPTGTIIRMYNTAPDAPFGGFPDVPADPSTTGQVLQFVVNGTPANAGGPLGASPTDPVLADGVTVNPAAATDPTLLALPAEQVSTLGAPSNQRDVSLNEEESGQVCVTVSPVGAISVVAVSPTPLPPGVGPGTIGAFCAATRPASIPMAPIAAKVGIVDQTNPALPLGIALNWTDMTKAGTDKVITLANGGTVTVNVTENPATGAVEDWNIYNFTVDAHPIHLHLVRFAVINRTPIPGVVPAPVPVPQQPWETGFKDTVIAYPGEITTVRARFDVAGLYVWHCHIVEHEDNEMMRPYVVGP
ncbi:multicopper oxidase domain-containing protein [Desulfuromonas carbonis]